MSKEGPQFEVRDLRTKEKFVIDDEFLNGYAKIVGIYAVGVYSSLCRHANKEQKCWPSISKMCEELNISHRSTLRAIKYLEFWGIIKKHRVGRRSSNRYDLIDKKHWRPVGEVSLGHFTSEVYRGHITSAPGAHHRCPWGTSIVRKHIEGNTKKERGKTPSKRMKDFLRAYWKKSERYKQFVKAVSIKYKVSRRFVDMEIGKFVSYWTEKNKSGTRQRWEMEKTFEVQRRLATWFRNANKFNHVKEPKGIRL